MSKSSKPQKIQIYEQLEHVSGYDVEGSIDDVIGVFQKLKDKYGSDIRVSYYHDNDSSEYAIYQYRIETDAEFIIRKDIEEQRLKQRREYDLELLKTLKAQYESEVSKS